MKTTNFFAKKQCQVPIHLCFSEPKYQRPLTRARVKKIVDNFEPIRVKAVFLNPRPDGRYAIVDGNATTTALKELGAKTIDALVYDPPLDYEEEARMFNHLNGDPVGVKTFYTFNAMYEARDPNVVEIFEVLDLLELKPMNGGTRSGQGKDAQIGCVSELQKVHAEIGKAGLLRTLKILINAWGPNSKSFASDLVAGVGRLIRVYSGLLDDVRLSKNLQRYTTPAELQANVRARFKSDGHDREAVTAEVLLDFYNRQLKQENRLPAQLIRQRRNSKNSNSKLVFNGKGELVLSE